MRLKNIQQLKKSDVRHQASDFSQSTLHCRGRGLVRKLTRDWRVDMENKDKNKTASVNLEKFVQEQFCRFSSRVTKVHKTAAHINAIHCCITSCMWANIINGSKQSNKSHKASCI